MNIKEELRINDHQKTQGYAGTDIGDFFCAAIDKVESSGFLIEQNIPFLMSQAYNYGIICGKREERARRKKKA